MSRPVLVLRITEYLGETYPDSYNLFSNGPKKMVHTHTHITTYILKKQIWPNITN